MNPKEANIRSSSLLICPTSVRALPNLAELWEHRELLYFLTWRNIKVRYKQTVLGAAWAIIQPLGMMVVFTLVFGRLVGVPSDGLPYPIFAFSALLPWQLFSGALTGSSTSLVANGSLITKVYFPRVLIPLSAVLSSLVDFAIAFVLLLGMMVFYGIVPTPAVAMLPVFILLSLMTALGVGFWLSALNAQYRDIRYMLPFLTQFWLFATPVVYPASLVPEQWRLLYGRNHMTGVVEGFRWALLGKAGGPDAMLVVSATVVLGIFIGGLYYFNRVDETLTDLV